MVKKKLDLSPEKLLERALVPESQWPYRVPKNWVWTKMQFIASWGSGGTPSRHVSEYYDGSIPWIKTGELNGGYIFETEEHLSDVALKNSSAKLYPSNTVMIAMYGATIGKVAIMGIPATTNQACACAVSNNIMNYKYLFHYAISQQENFVELGKGGAQPNISQEVIKNHYIPLPPLAEQQRIIDRIESLFEKLDLAKEMIQDALDSFENRKNAILHKAFCGELTKKWREENGFGMDTWEYYSLSDCVVFSKEKYDPSKEVTIMPYVGLEHIEKNRGIIGSGNSEEIRSLKNVFRTGDILYGKLRPYLNKHDIATFNGICSTDILVMRNDNSSTTRYINYLLNTSSFLEYSVANSQGINLPRVSEKIISQYEFKIPTILEQEEIISILDDVMEKESNAFNLYDLADSIDLMKKSILARAFRGELGTNDPEEDSAIKLLETVLCERAGES